jgi:MraZ protein
MFIGEYTHSIDPKGRMAVPSKMRRELGGGAVITRGLDQCLWVFTKKEWENLAGKLAQLPISDPKSRAFSRLMLAGAMEVEFDSQGRALIPGYLKEYANLKREAVIAGLYNRLEIWETSAWQKFKADSEKQTDEISKHMMDLGV